MKSLLKCVNDINYVPLIYTLSVRWATKPRWVPVAKTKKFRVIQAPKIPIEETVEIRRLTHNYKTKMKAIIGFLKQNYRENETSENIIEKYEQDKENAWQECLKINDEWNEIIAIEREERNACYVQQRMEAIELHKQKVDERNRERQELVERLIKEQKELSKTFITKENIDAHIEKILNSTPFSFNYAIDLNGKIYEGNNKTESSDKSFRSKSKEERNENIA